MAISRAKHKSQITKSKKYENHETHIINSIISDISIFLYSTKATKPPDRTPSRAQNNRHHPHPGHNYHSRNQDRHILPRKQTKRHSNHHQRKAKTQAPSHPRHCLCRSWRELIRCVEKEIPLMNHIKTEPDLHR